MNLFSTAKSSTLIFCLLIITIACLPIWSVDTYLNQDGTPHLYNSYLILEILKNNPIFTDIYALNPAPLPNLSGHYILAFLLLFFQPLTVTKIMATATFGGMVAAAWWLRTQVCGRVDGVMSVLLGTAFAFNWMWFLGFYNFIVGVIGFTFTLGLFWRWRERLDFKKCLVLSLLVIVVFFSHLISFGMLAGGVFLIAVFGERQRLKRNLFRTTAIFLPVLPLIIGYKFLSEKGGGLSPVWRFLQNPLSPADWATQLLAADPFQLLSRKAFPFVQDVSSLYAVFTPFLWVAAGLLLLSAATFLTLRQNKTHFSRLTPFALMFALSVVFWIFAPDDFGKAHGAFLRERVLLCGVICFIPLFQIENRKFFRRAAAACLVFATLFQTATLWEYAAFSDKIGREYLAGQSLIHDSDSIGSVVSIKDGCRYKASPMANLTTLYGIGKNTRVWDNYEIGYYLFPVVAKDAADRRFTYDFREVGFFDLCSKNEATDEKFAELESLINTNDDKMSVMLVWDGDERIFSILMGKYQPEPFFQNERLRLFRHR